MINIIKRDNSNLYLKFPYDKNTVAIVKTLQHVKYNPIEKDWKIPTLYEKNIYKTFDQFGLEYIFRDETFKELQQYSLYQPKLKLYPEQTECVQFALNNESVIFNMDIGFGKTSTALITVNTLYKSNKIKRILIVVPNTLKYQWKTELQKFTDLTFCVIDGPKNKRIYNTSATCVIVGYETLRNDINIILNEQWDVLIVDEITRIKNEKAKISKALKLLKPKYKFALTGAILENRIEELYNILNFVKPTTFNSYFDFASRYLIRSLANRPFGTFWEIVGFKNLDNLRNVMNDFVIKRKLTDLPELHYKTYKVPMTIEQRKAYNLVEEECIKELKEGANPLAKFMYLRQCCNAPQTIGLEGKSNKIEELKEILKECNDNQIIVFTQFSKFAYLIANELRKIDIIPTVVTGDMNSKEKDEAIQAWKSSGKILVCTDCLSYGHNLQNANILIMMDLVWNPKKMEQRVGRIWRRGQTKGCLVINIVSENSAEERVMQILQEKNDLIEEVLNEDVQRFELTHKNELLAILEGNK